MDPSSSDLEFFDFKNSSDEEIKEIQAILKGPGSNGCVELPWEISVRNNTAESLPETEVAPEADLAPATTKCVETTPVPPPNFVPQPEPQLPPGIETFVTLPTTVGPYQNAPYFVSRTLPYLRAYPPMGMPFFACPLSGDGSPYGHILPVNAENPSPETPKSRPSNKVKKRTDSIENGDAPIGPSSVPLVPLPQSTFAVAGYPPGLHTLPYAQMAGQTSPAMYYVPVFNHPYGGYLPSPPIMLPEEVNESRVNMEKTPPAECDVHQTCEVVELKEDLALPTAKVAEEQTVDSSSEPLSEGSSPGYLQDSGNSLLKTVDNVPNEALLKDCQPEPCSSNIASPEAVASNIVLSETTPSNNALTNMASLSDSLPEETPPCLTGPVAQETCQANVDEILSDKTVQEPATDSVPEQAKVNEVVKPVVKGCWADLFKGPREVNGIDRHPPKRSTLKKDVANGKVYSVPAKH